MSLVQAIDELLTYVRSHPKTPDYGDRLPEFNTLDAAVYIESRRLGLQESDLPRKDATFRDDEVVYFGRCNVPACWNNPPDAPTTLTMMATQGWVADMYALRALGAGLLKEATQAAPQVEAKEEPLPTIWFHGGQSYSPDGLHPKAVSQEMHNVLKKFLDCDQAFDSRELSRSGASNVTTVVGNIEKKFGKDAIRRPPSKGDGYSIRVRSKSTN